MNRNSWHAVSTFTRPPCARAGHEVGLGKGIILEHLVVHRRWAGRSLAALDLRGSTGITVLEWLRGDAVLPVDPNAALREGDVLAAVGTREQFLQARRLQ